MPGYKTLAELVDLTRQEVGEFDTSTLLDGYIADKVLNPYPAPKIVPFLNDGLREFKKTGFNKCFFTITVPEGANEFLLTRKIELITRVAFRQNGREIDTKAATIAGLDAIYGTTWRNRLSTRPIYWYPLGTRGMGVYPKLSAGSPETKVHIIADELVPDMVFPGDIPAPISDSNGDPILTDGIQESSLPESLHSSLSLWAAYKIHAQRKEWESAREMKARWQEAFNELCLLSNRRIEENTRSVEVDRHAVVSSVNRGNRGWRGSSQSRRRL